MIQVPPNPALSPHAIDPAYSVVPPDPSPIGEMSVQAWVNISAVPASYPALVVGKNSEYQLRIATNGSPEFVVMAVNGDSPEVSGGFAGGFVTPNQWHHLVGTYRKQSFLRIYLDGVLVGELITPTFPGWQPGVTHSPILIGDGGLFYGLIDEVAVFRRALSTNEIQALFNAGPAGMAPICPVPPTGLADWWTADGTARDLVGPADGYLQGGAAYAPGLVGQAFSLDGVSGYVRIPHHPSLDARSSPLDDVNSKVSFSYEAWIKTTNATGKRIILEKANSGGCVNGQCSLMQLSLIDGKPLAVIRDSNGGGPAEEQEGQMLLGTNSLADGQFHHLAMVRSIEHTQMLLYVDGTLATNAPLNAGSRDGVFEIGAGTHPLLIGADASLTNFYHGLIDEVAFYHRAVTLPEVQSIYAAGRLGKSRPVRVNLSALGGGSIMVWPPSTNNFVGDTLSLTATNARYYRFLGWSDGVTNNPRTVVLGLSNDIRAVFTKSFALEELVFQMWDKSYGGSGEDVCNSAFRAADGRFLLAGASASGVSGNKTDIGYGGQDFWEVDLSGAGEKVYELTRGGPANDVANIIRPAPLMISSWEAIQILPPEGARAARVSAGKIFSRLSWRPSERRL